MANLILQSLLEGSKSTKMIFPSHTHALTKFFAGPAFISALIDKKFVNEFSSGRFREALDSFNQGANANARAPDGKNALMHGVLFSSFNFVWELRRSGVDPHAQDNYGNTAFIYAAMRSDTHLGQTIHEQFGADPSIKNNQNVDAFDIAKLKAGQDPLNGGPFLRFLNETFKPEGFNETFRPEG